MKIKQVLSIVSTVATVTGLVASLVNGIVNEKKQQIEIEEAVNKRLAEQRKLLLIEMKDGGSN